MNTTELIQDVRALTRSNVKDYTDAAIQQNIDQEYYFWQQVMVEQGDQSISSTQSLDVLDVTLTGDFAVTLPNMNIERVEAEIDGKWYRLMPKDATTFGGVLRDYGCHCPNIDIGRCYCGSLTDWLAAEGNPYYYIPTTDGIHVFPIPASGTLDIKIYHQQPHILDWVGGDTPKLPRWTHRLLTLQASLLYRDIEKTNDLEYLLRLHETLGSRFIQSLKGPAGIKKMHFKFKRFK